MSSVQFYLHARACLHKIDRVDPVMKDIIHLCTKASKDQRSVSDLDCNTSSVVAKSIGLV